MEQPNIDSISPVANLQSTQRLLDWQGKLSGPDPSPLYSPDESPLPEDLTTALGRLQEAIQVQTQSHHGMPDLVRITSIAVTSLAANFIGPTRWTLDDLLKDPEVYKEAVLACSIALGRLALKTEVSAAFDRLMERRGKKNSVSGREKLLLLAYVNKPQTWTPEFLGPIARSSFLTAVDHTAGRRGGSRGSHD